ncbi:hypothetical protein QGN29_10135 [Temperatibacter marinus]|uniref:Uncharacterized protein n=1 Tax=Temperatibacter marinus TaxID=1456591 RepID=A0AA52H9P7_9PROT|nr:hypothetical protein [Temperatibacter marinus]WND01910.1 hypothetical protein QGN29_10135 [Temperatibacter marinus]
MTVDPRMAIFSRSREKSEKPTQKLKDASMSDEDISEQSTLDTSSQKPQNFTGPGQRLIDITEQLTSLIKQETGFLLSRATKDAANLHGEKSRLMALYKTTLHHLQVNEHLLGPKESAIRGFIRKVTDSFRDALKEHTRVVIRMKSISEGIIRSIGEEVTKQNRPVVGYGANAAMVAPKSATTTSISLNQVI